MTGVICINKDEGITSFGVVAKLRGILGEKKIGHMGTLDPMATGVLPVMLGGATRFLNYLGESDKGYRASFVLGKTTDTLDITGKVLTTTQVTATCDDVKNVLEQFRGKIKQVPPMYSAKSVDGVRLYNLARQGKQIERKPCDVEIKRLDLVQNVGDEYVIDVLCSMGTYIRSLIDDIGQALGCGAVMTALTRTYASGFTLDDCVTLGELQQRKDNQVGFDDLVVDIQTLFADLSQIVVTPAQANRFSNGGALDIDRLKKVPIANELCAVYSVDKTFLGLGISDGTQLKIARLLTKRD